MHEADSLLWSMWTAVVGYCGFASHYRANMGGFLFTLWNVPKLHIVGIWICRHSLILLHDDTLSNIYRRFNAFIIKSVGSCSIVYVWFVSECLYRDDAMRAIFHTKMLVLSWGSCYFEQVMIANIVMPLCYKFTGHVMWNYHICSHEGSVGLQIW